jgi:hypothetical protein
MSSFSSSGHMIADWCSFRGVAADASACTLMYSGCLRLSLARSRTDLVWVALKRKVWRPVLGRKRRIAFTEVEKPMSRIRSASSRTSTCGEERSCPMRKIHQSARLTLVKTLNTAQDGFMDDSRMFCVSSKSKTCGQRRRQLSIPATSEDLEDHIDYLRNVRFLTVVQSTTEQSRLSRGCGLPRRAPGLADYD